jgi:hypothetical protein
LKKSGDVRPALGRLSNVALTDIALVGVARVRSIG